MKREINFDYNASAGLSPRVRAALFDIDLGLNPSSIHRGGQRSRALIESSREQILTAVAGKDQYELVFTSGATEANNTAILSQLWSQHDKSMGPAGSESQVVTLSVEHPSVLEPLKRLAKHGHLIHVVSPNSRDWEEHLLQLVTESTSLVSIMLANNETGRIFNLPVILPRIRKKSPGVLIHVDLVQALGKIPLNLKTLDLDLASLSGHKIGALSGTGALLVRRSRDLHPLIVGGSQELRRRAGTENVMGIVSFGLAAAHVTQDLSNRIERMCLHRDFLERTLLQQIDDVQILDHEHARIGNTSCVRVPGVKADDLIVALDFEGIHVSSGAACSSGKPEPSHVLLSLGLSELEAKECLRISIDPDLDAESVEHAIEKIVASVLKFRLFKRTGNA